MNVAPLQSGCCLIFPADHQLSCAKSLPHVCVTFTAGQSAAGSPGKAIDQRLCVVERCGESDSEYFEASDRPDQQQTPEPQQSDGDGPWQVVRRRRSGRKRQQRCDVRDRKNFEGVPGRIVTSWV